MFQHFRYLNDSLENDAKRLGNFREGNIDGPYVFLILKILRYEDSRTFCMNFTVHMKSCPLFFSWILSASWILIPLRILNNLFVNPVTRKGIYFIETSDDSTCYSLTVTKHYLAPWGREKVNLSRKEKSSIHSHWWISKKQCMMVIPFRSDLRVMPTIGRLIW